MAAEATVLMMFSASDILIVHNDLYGGTYRLFEDVFRGKGIKAHFVDLCDLPGVENLLCSGAKAIWIETPTNPLMNLVDIRAIAQLAKLYGALTICDNTFLSP